MTALIGFQNKYVLRDPPGSDIVATSAAVNPRGCQIKTFYFADADNTELFIPPRGTLACAWQPSGITHLGTWKVGSTGLIFTGTANGLGWLHCLVRGAASTGGTTTEAPVAKGTSGWVNHGYGIVLNERGSATPATVTNGRRLPSKNGLKFKTFEFASTSDDDTWECTTAGLCHGVVAVAWQADDPAEDVNVTLNAANNVVFNSTAGSASFGWLWAWTR